MKNESQITNNQTKNTKPTFSHDTFFKLFYSDSKLAQELFQLIFSKQEIKSYYLKKLKIEKDTLENKRADLVFSIPLKGHLNIQFTIFILLEHKSYYDENLFDQLLEYQILIRKYSRQRLGRVMPILPVLFYHGRTPFKWKKISSGRRF